MAPSRIPGDHARFHQKHRSTSFGELTGVFALLGLFLVIASALGQTQYPQPVVAIHDSELTRALESIPATPPTLSGAGTSGFEWWLTNWHYFAMSESVQEALRSDGTPFAVLGDSNIVAGILLTNGLPKYPILISLASEAMQDAEISPLTNYIAAGGFLFIGSSSFTRNPNGTTRSDFAIGVQMGLHMVVPGLTNWAANSAFSRQADHRLVTHIPNGILTWRFPSGAEEMPWGISPSHPFLGPHTLWRVQVADASVLAIGDASPYLTVKKYGKGYFIYYAGIQPLLGYGGFAPSMYSYVILRRAIEWSFEAQNMPIPKLSPWPYPYDAAFMIRHDLENYTNEMAAIEASAQFEFTNGVKGDYYVCTGTIRDDANPAYDTNAIIAGLRRAVTNYGATIGPHNGGLKNPNNPTLARGQYDYWHWGLDEALDTSPTNYPDGKTYALASLSNAFNDVETWLSGITNGIRVWAAPYFNSTRDGSYQIQTQLNVKIAGEQKLTPFPHWTVSTRTSGLPYKFLSEPTSDWFVNGLVAQSLEPWHAPGVHTSQTVHDAVDFYYGLGALINLYSHTLSTGLGAAGPLVADSITYTMNTNLHPRVWPNNAVGIYNWWVQRSNSHATVSYSTNADQCITTFSMSKCSNVNAAVELLVPGSGSAFNIQLFTNNVLGGTDRFRTNGQVIKVLTGTTVTNAQIRYYLGPRAQNDSYSGKPGLPLNIAAPGVLGNDGSGMSTNVTAWVLIGPTNGDLILNPNGGFTYTPATSLVKSDGFSYQAIDERSNASSTFVSLSLNAPAALFADDFTRPTDPGSPSPWISQVGIWTVSGGTLLGGTNTLSSYAFLYITNTWTNFAVQARFQFPVGAFGGGLGGRLTAANGKHYAAWIYPENSPGGSNVLKLIKFTSWGSYGYTNTVGAPMKQVSLPSVGTNWHTLKLGFQGNQIVVCFDGTQQISVPDIEAQPYASGAVSIDMWTDAIGYRMAVDDVVVTTIVNDDKYSTDEDTPLNIPAPGVLGNDTEIYGTNLTATVINNPTNGSLTLNADGAFLYVPAANHNGSDAFTYQANDGGTNLGTATVTITVYPVNDPPMLPQQIDRTIAALTTLRITNTASDVDLPAQFLSYTLLDPPNGVDIDTTGLITWTPGESQAGVLYTITTQVTDDGIPPMSDTNSFRVFVDGITPLIVIQSITLGTGIASIKWTSEVGKTYRLQYADNIPAGNWQSAAPDVTASGTTSTAIDNSATSAIRFYRVLRLP